MTGKRAKDVMTPASEVITVDSEETLKTAVDRLATNHISGLPVLRNGIVVGVLCDSDVARVLHLQGGTSQGALEGTAGLRVSEVMTKPVVSVSPDADLNEILRIMAASDVNRVVVTNDKMELQGLITRSDVIRAAFPVSG